MKYKLLAIDMDGTFLDGEHKPTKKNYYAVKKAAQLGMKVVICSGRIPAAIKALVDYMPENQPIIAGNGSIILNSNHEEIYKESIDYNTVTNIISMFRKDYDNVYYQIMDADVVYAESIGKTVTDFLLKLNLSLPRKHRMEFRLIPDLLTYIRNNGIKASKIEIYEENISKLNKIRSDLKNLANVEVVNSGEYSLEIIKKGLSKGNALEVLAKYYGYSLDECIAIGNDENDIEMISKAGLGIAVKNAKDKVKKIADYITEKDNENSAVAEVVEKFIIEKEI